MSHTVYSTKFDIMMSSSKLRAGFKHNFGKLPNEKNYLIMEGESAISYSDYLGVRIASEELFWNETKRKVIFIDDIDLLHNLSSAKYDFNQNVLIPTPFETFALSFPKGAVIDGCQLSPCLVNIMKGDRYNEQVTYPYLNLIKSELGEPYSSEIYNISVTYHEGGYSICHAVEMSNVIDLINDGFNELSHNSPFYNQKLSKEENKKISILFKIALLTSIYNNATSGEYLTNRFPTGKVLYPKGRNKASYDSYTLTNMFKLRESKKGKLTTLKNLSSPKYYTGEYSHMPIGSRWIMSYAQLPG